uniref:NADH dehydrogenase subunit 4l n=1 Tax=Neolepetopsis sp. TaxID=3071115 RepID=A0AA96HSS5_9GAST|nr:NADH dehydrogenase subunit 4l [Neolepetopsis sp.]
MTINVNLTLMLTWMTLLSSFLSLSIQTKHLIMILLLLETLALTTLMSILYTQMMLINMYTPMIMFLTMSVCEASLALSVLVSLLRSNGNDYVELLTMKKL